MASTQDCKRLTFLQTSSIFQVMSRPEFMWEVLNIVHPKRLTPLKAEEVKAKLLQELEQAASLQEFLDKPISEVFPPKQK